MKNFIQKHKIKFYWLIGILLSATVLVTFGYFALESAGLISVDADVVAGAVDKVYFTEGDGISLQMSQDNLYAGAGNLSDSSTSYVTLYNDSNSDSASHEYSLNLFISQNTYSYSDKENYTPELIITITGPNGEIIDDVEGLEYVTVNGVTGFDVTTEIGSFTIATDYEIIATEDKEVHDWVVTLYIMNLDVNQNGNLDSIFSSNVSLFDTETLSEAILSDNGGSSYIILKEEPNFADMAITDEGMYAAEDDFGTSYYFRGAVENNYVLFADMLWRIVRIDGNGDVKLMLYNEDETETSYEGMNNGKTYLYNSLQEASYYLGYMYTENELHGLTTDSDIKYNIDLWYEDNLIDYTEYISETAIYCNDRVAYDVDGLEITSSDYSGAEDFVNFVFKRRLEFLEPTLICSNNLDAFTVSEETGNGALTYPIGLLTADEIIMAGARSFYANDSFYLYTGVSYFSLTPYNFDNSSNNALIAVMYVGYISTGASNSIINKYKTFPSITLNSSVLIGSGDGTLDNPYVVNTK